MKFYILVFLLLGGSAFAEVTSVKSTTMTIFSDLTYKIDQERMAQSCRIGVSKKSVPLGVAGVICEYSLTLKGKYSLQHSSATFDSSQFGEIQINRNRLGVDVYASVYGNVLKFEVHAVKFHWMDPDLTNDHVVAIQDLIRKEISTIDLKLRNFYNNGSDILPELINDIKEAN